MRRFPRSALNAFGRWVSAHCWFEHAHPYDSSSVDYLTSSFSDDLSNAINIYFLTKRVRLQTTCVPINPGCLLRSNLSFSNDNVPTILGLPKNGDTLETKYGKSSANAKRSYSRKVQNLKGTDPRNWSGLVNKLAGKPTVLLLNCAIQTRTATLYLVRPSPLV